MLWKNEGGAADFRTDGREQAMVRLLQAQWPGAFRLHHKADKELLDRGADVDYTDATDGGSTSLMLAFKDGHIDVGWPLL
jgi:hypothetical protein